MVGDHGGMPVDVDLVEELGADAYVYGHVNLFRRRQAHHRPYDGRQPPTG